MTAGVADHVLALLLVVLGTAFGAGGRTTPEESVAWSPRDKVHHYLGASAALWILAAIVLGVWLFFGRSLDALGLGAVRLTPLATWTLLFLLAALLLDTWIQRGPARRARTRSRWLHRSPFMPASPRELRFYAILAVSAGLCEELVFRGFLVTYLASLFGTGWPNVAFAILLPAAVFGVGHRRQGIRGIVGSAGWAIVGGIVLIDSGSLWSVIIAHAGWDFLIGALGMGIMRGAAR